MNIFKKIASLFGKKKKEEPVVSEPAVVEEQPKEEEPTPTQMFIHAVQESAVEDYKKAEEEKEVIKEETPEEVEETVVEEKANNEYVSVEVNGEPVVVEETVEEEKQYMADSGEIEYLTITEEIKNMIADDLRPVVKKFNKELKDEYKKYLPEGEEVKTLKTFVSLVDEDKLCVCKFTQSESYNKKINEFVKENLAQVIDFSKFEEFAGSYFLECEDGKIKIRFSKI